MELARAISARNNFENITFLVSAPIPHNSVEIFPESVNVKGLMAFFRTKKFFVYTIYIEHKDFRGY